MARPADDQELLLQENALGNDGTRATRAEEPGDRRQGRCPRRVKRPLMGAKRRAARPSKQPGRIADFQAQIRIRQPQACVKYILPIFWAAQAWFSDERQ
ncbi:MAG: hypothetical protein A2Y74_07700 [Actinobacteria bacterium RBG_13_63_9]|nr:MAG: hypothetical protein A2Y74_07700 [Actinobacteria bacterium RBG_13_63_9]